MATVAEQFVTVLRQAGVERIYGLVGDSLNPIVDAVRRTEGIEWIHVHNEEAAAFAAGADALLTGKLAVCAGSCGPGNTHLVQGLYDAHRNGAPVLALASHIPASEIGTGFFQETHPEQLFAECSHYCELVSQPEQMPRLQHIAMQNALGRRGVAVLVLPGDVAFKKAAHPTSPTVLAAARPRMRPAEEQVRALADRITRARTVTLLCGAGAADARDQVLRLAGALQSPVAHALGGKDVIQYDNPYDVGMTGLLGYGAAYDAMHQADLLVMLGTDFPYDYFLPQRNTVQVDIDPGRIGRRTVLDVAVLGDVGETIEELLPLLTPRTDRRFLDDMLRKHAELLDKVVSVYTRNVGHHTPIHPEHVAAQLDELASDDAVFTVDTGMCNVWAARYLTPNGRRRVIGSWRHGTMANALPQAIGAQFAYPGRQVVSMSGDGGLSMLMGELITVVQHDLPVKILLFNNSSLAMVKLEMLVDGLPSYQTDHPPVDFSAIARGVGMPVLQVTRPDDVRSALADGLARPGPVLIEMVTDPNALSVPPHVTMDQVKGFALGAAKLVLEGGVGAMVELARSNLRNIPHP
jgi:pyruvate dehydrogenase (quinone)